MSFKLKGLITLPLVLVLTLGALGAAGNWAQSVHNVLISEGGARYTNDPRDPGGPTKYGVTIYDVRLYLNPRATAADVKALTYDQAVDIYRNHYWLAVRGDDLARGLDYTVFDYAVNSGMGRAGRVLRAALGLPTDDWHVTDEVIAAAKRRNPADLINVINTDRLAFLHHLRTYSVFGRGWDNRVHSVRLNSLRMANPNAQADVFPTGQYIPRVGPHKAYDTEAIQEQQNGTGF